MHCNVRISSINNLYTFTNLSWGKRWFFYFYYTDIYYKYLSTDFDDILTTASPIFMCVSLMYKCALRSTKQKLNYIGR